MYRQLLRVLGITLLAPVGSGAAGQSAPAIATRPAPAVFAEKARFVHLALSPDGAQIAAVERDRAKVKVVVFQASGADLGFRNFDVGRSDIVGIRWAGSNRLLVETGTVYMVMGVSIPITRLILVDLQTGAHRELLPDSKSPVAGEVIHVDPAGQWLLIAAPKTLGATPQVKRIELATGAETLVEKARSGVWNWFVDTEGVVRAGIAYQDDRWTMWYRDRPDAPLAKVRPRNSEGIQGAVDQLYFFPGENAGAIVTNARSDRFAAYRFDFRTGEIGEPIFEHPRVDVTAIVSHPVTRKIAGVSFEDERAQTEWVEPEMRVVQRRLDKALPGQETRMIDRSADGKRLLIWSGSASDPGTHYLFDVPARRLEAIVRPFERLAQVQLSPVAPIRYAARDGLSIPGYLTLPAGQSGRGLPLVVLPHGGPFVRDNWSYDPFVQFLASRGYAVLQPNFRGSTGYGKNFVEQGYGQWGRKMQDDVDDGVDWLAGQGIVDPKRVCIMGISYGGYVALWGAIRNPERYRCAISLAGVTDLPGMLRYDRKGFSAPRYFRAWEQRVRGDKDTDLKALSPLAQAARLNVPVMIAHGDQDWNVPAEQAQKLVKALRARPGAREVLSLFYKGEGHGLSETANIADFLTQLETFLAKHNPPDAARP